MVEQRKPVRGWHQHFYGFRVNCESIPVLPAGVVRWVLDDPRKIPYLLVWQNQRTGEVQEAVRISRFVPPCPAPKDDWIEIKRTNGSLQAVRVSWRTLPRNGGRDLLLVCSYCRLRRRYLYGWEAYKAFGQVIPSDWACRTCSALGYASEGGALLIRSRGWLGRLFGTARSPRPEPWYPYVFSSPELAAEAGLCSLKLL